MSFLFSEPLLTLISLPRIIFLTAGCLAPLSALTAGNLGPLCAVCLCLPLSPVKAVVKPAHWLFWPVVFCQAVPTALALDTVLSQECGQISAYSA